MSSQLRGPFFSLIFSFCRSWELFWKWAWPQIDGWFAIQPGSDQVCGDYIIICFKFLGADESLWWANVADRQVDMVLVSPDWLLWFGPVPPISTMMMNVKSGSDSSSCGQWKSSFGDYQLIKNSLTVFALRHSLHLHVTLRGCKET